MARNASAIASARAAVTAAGLPVAFRGRARVVWHYGDGAAVVRLPVVDTAAGLPGHVDVYTADDVRPVISSVVTFLPPGVRFEDWTGPASA
jgi:hypothetical protein